VGATAYAPSLAVMSAFFSADRRRLYVFSPLGVSSPLVLELTTFPQSTSSGFSFGIAEWLLVVLETDGPLLNEERDDYALRLVLGGRCSSMS